eukprot:gene20740-40622_t
MDHTHAEFVEQLNQLLNTPTDQQLPLYQAFLAHTVAHFAQEERWMLATGFAPDNCHAAHHATILDTMRAVETHHRQGDLDIITRLAEALAQATAQRLKIVAPFDGIAGIRGVNVGDYLKDGADIVNIEDLDAVYVDFRLPERLQSKARTGQTAQVAFDALPGVRYAAVVQAISPQIDADGRAIAVRGCIDNRRLQLRPGMFARVTAVFAERSDARVVPEEAIVPEGSSPYVLKIVEGKEPGTRVTRRTPVQLGARAPGLVEVVEGLNAGDLVVTAGQQRIRKDGTEVRVVELGKQGAGGAPSAARPASGPQGGN